jgi:hypothetical protein
MIDYLDNMLRHLFITHIDEITGETQVRFQPPDEAWRTHVSSLTANALNIYLFDLRENRKRRSNARVRVGMEDGRLLREPAPARLGCHYLISAWSPVSVANAMEPTVDEHVLLYRAATVLMQNAPLNPSRIYTSASILNTVPESIREADLPTQVLPPEGFPKLAEFWGTMGVNHRWKPVIYLVVTLPVERLTEVAGPMVTTTMTEYRHTGRPETAEVWIQIGGQVLDATVDPPVPVAGAWVRLENVGGEPLQTVETDQSGRFIFGELQPGQYQLNWRATGYPVPAAPRMITVPSPSGEYDLSFE